MKDNQIIQALKFKYEYEVNKHRVDLNNFINNPVAVAEHESIVDTADIIVEKLATSEEKLATLEAHVGGF